jgi:hypothetical protein
VREKKKISRNSRVKVNTLRVTILIYKRTTNKSKLAKTTNEIISHDILKVHACNNNIYKAHQTQIDVGF